MTYKEFLESLQKLNENALSKNAIVWDIDDQEFKDIDYSAIGRCEIEKASVFPSFHSSIFL